MAEEIRARFHVSQHLRFSDRNGEQRGLFDQFRLQGIFEEGFVPSPSASIDIFSLNPDGVRILNEAIESGQEIEAVFSLVEPTE